MVLLFEKPAVHLGVLTVGEDQYKALYHVSDKFCMKSETEECILRVRTVWEKYLEEQGFDGVLKK